MGDFGLAAKLEFDNDKRYTVCGTPNYIAPEILENKIGHSYGVDVWSLGVIIYTLVVGKPPFETDNVKETYKRIKACAYKFPENSNSTPAVRKLINQILVKDPAKRLSLDEILNSEFLNKGQGIPLTIPSSLLNNPNSQVELEKHFNLGKKKGEEDSKKFVLNGAGSTTIKPRGSSSKFDTEINDKSEKGNPSN